jgi:hypothetical protein
MSSFLAGKDEIPGRLVNSYKYIKQKVLGDLIFILAKY